MMIEDIKKYRRESAKNSPYLVSGWEATHCSRARALHTLLDWWAVSTGGLMAG